MRVLLAFELGRLRARLDNILDGQGRRERLEATRLGLAVALPLLLVGGWLYLHVTARATPQAAGAREPLLAQSAALTALLLVDAYRRAATQGAFAARYQRWLLGLGVPPHLVAARTLVAALAGMAAFAWVPLVPLLPLRGTTTLGLELLALPAAAILTGTALGTLDATTQARWLRGVPAALWIVPAAATVLPEALPALRWAAPLLGLWSASLGPGRLLVCVLTLLASTAGALALCSRALAAAGWEGGGRDGGREHAALEAGAPPSPQPLLRPSTVAAALLARDLRRLLSWAAAEPIAPFVLLAFLGLPYASRLPVTESGAAWALLWSSSLAVLALSEVLCAGEAPAWWALLRAAGRLPQAARLRAGVLAATVLVLHAPALLTLPPAWRLAWLTLVLAMVIAGAAAATVGAAAAAYAELEGLLGRLLRAALVALALLATFGLAIRHTSLLALCAALSASAPLLWLAPKLLAWSGAHSSTR